jgi:hypothetical protein
MSQGLRLWHRRSSSQLYAWCHWLETSAHCRFLDMKRVRALLVGIPSWCRKLNSFSNENTTFHSSMYLYFKRDHHIDCQSFLVPAMHPTRVMRPSVPTQTRFVLRNRSSSAFVELRGPPEPLNPQFRPCAMSWRGILWGRIWGR